MKPSKKINGLFCFLFRYLDSWTLFSGQEIYGLFLRRLVGILQAQGILKIPWRSNPAATTKVATTKTAMGQVVGITNREAAWANKSAMAKEMNLASNRALVRVAQPHLLIKFNTCKVVRVLTLNRIRRRLKHRGVRFWKLLNKYERAFHVNQRSANASWGRKVGCGSSLFMYYALMIPSSQVANWYKSLLYGL